MCVLLVFVGIGIFFPDHAWYNGAYRMESLLLQYIESWRVLWVSRIFFGMFFEGEGLLFAAFYLARQGYLDIGDTYIIANLWRYNPEIFFGIISGHLRIPTVFAAYPLFSPCCRAGRQNCARAVHRACHIKVYIWISQNNHFARAASTAFRSTHFEKWTYRLFLYGQQQ